MSRQINHGDNVRKIETSSIIASIPENYSKLAEIFTLARYSIPNDASGQSYDDVHLDLHRQLTQPYRVLWPGTDRGVYVLWQLGDTVASLTLLEQQVEPQIIEFSAIPFHLVIKLLMEEYFRGDTGLFTGQGKRFLFVKWEQRRNSALCLEFDIKAAAGVKSDDPEQEFTVIASSRRFRHQRAEYIRPGRYIYYGRTFAPDGAMTMPMLTRKEVARRIENQEDMWSLWAGKDTPARLEFFSERDIETSRGYLLHSFCQRFAERLNSFGIAAHLKKRAFTRYSALRPEQASSLDLQLAGAHFYVLDMRHHQSIPLEYYVQQFSDWFKQCSFTAVEEGYLTQTNDGATLVLMDAEKTAYEELLVDIAHRDPYPLLYAAHPDIPLQGFNVNPNMVDPPSSDVEAYLSYQCWTEEQEEEFEQHAQLALRDALLKHLLLRQRPLSSVLPKTPALNRYAFIHRGLYEGKRHTTIFYVQDDVPQLIAVGDHNRNALELACAKYDVRWDLVEDAMNERRSALPGARFDPMREYDFFVVVGNQTASEIVDMPEYALHQFDEILRRYEEREPQHLDFFLALPYCDAYAEQQNWPKQTDIERLSLQSVHESLPNGQSETCLLWGKLQKHDEFIRDLSIGLDRISYRDLQKREDYLHLLQSIGLSLRDIRQVFNAGGCLRNPRGTDIVFYTGIWFDNSDQTYMVGSPQAINQKQKNALTLRKFEPLIGQGVNLEDMLQLMAVGFVRLEQYTVLPYPFKLLRLYVENYLQWSLRGNPSTA